MKPLLFVTSLLFLACSTSKKCPGELSKIDYMEGYAHLHLPVSVDAKNFESYVNGKLPDTLYYDENAGGQGVELEVSKTGSPSVKLNGRTAEVVLPLSIKANRDLGFLRAKADGQMFLTLVSVIDIKSDWTIKTQSKVENIEWEKEPKLKMAGLSLSVTSLVERLINSPDNSVASQLDQMIADEQPLVSMIEGLKPQFERSYPLDPDGQYFIQVIPHEAGIASFVEDGGVISSQAIIDAKAFVARDSSEVRTVGQTPSFDWADNKESPYDMSLHFSLQDAEIETLMRDGVVGQTFIFRKKRVTMDQVYFDLQKGKIKVDAHLSGGIKGVIHFEGVPIWNDRKSEFEFCDQDIKIDIKYGVSKFMLWLFKSQIENVMAKKLNEGINEEIESRIEEINTYLNDFQPSDKVKVRAEIYEYAVDPILVKGRRLQLGINLNVRGYVSFEELQLDIR